MKYVRDSFTLPVSDRAKMWPKCGKSQGCALGWAHKGDCKHCTWPECKCDEQCKEAA